jgi:hypothetical protein
MTSITRATAARRLLAAAVCAGFTGCSVVSVQRPRPPAEVEDPRVLEPCTTWPVAPVLDHVVAVAALFVGFTSYIVQSMGPDGNYKPTLAALATAGAFGGSATYGYVTTARCRHVREDDRRCVNGDLWTCQKLSPGWTPPPGWRAPEGGLEPGPVPAPSAPAPDPASAGTLAAPGPR